MTTYTAHHCACAYTVDGWSSLEDCHRDCNVARGFWLRFDEEEEIEKEERRLARERVDEEIRALEAARVETYGTPVEQERERLTDAHMLTGRGRIRECAPMSKRRW